MRHTAQSSGVTVTVSDRIDVAHDCEDNWPAWEKVCVWIQRVMAECRCGVGRHATWPRCFTCARLRQSARLLSEKMDRDIAAAIAERGGV